jgi:hypothetical protein
VGTANVVTGWGKREAHQRGFSFTLSKGLGGPLAWLRKEAG